MSTDQHHQHLQPEASTSKHAMEDAVEDDQQQQQHSGSTAPPQPPSKKRSKKDDEELVEEGSGAAALLRAAGSGSFAVAPPAAAAAATVTTTAEGGGSASKTKRKKVSKACIFCKRSHMTCTENRPCDRCIKRDIAHLCQDSEPVKRSSSSSNNNNQADTTQEGQQSQAESQTSPGAATSGDTSTFSQHQHQPQSPSQASPEIKLHRASASSSEPPANGTQAQEPTSPLFTASKGELVDTATSSSNAAAPYSTTDNPSDPSPPPMLHRASSHSSYQQSPVYHNQNTQALPPPNTSLPSFTNEITQTPTTAAQRLSTGQAYGNASESSSSNNNSNTNNNPAANGSGSGSNAQNTSSNQQQQQPFNPFTLLNQAYDYSYPSHANSSNSLASLRLFASTADAQYGNLGQSGFNLGSGTNLYGGHGAGSDAGTNSDVDSTALDDFLKTLDEMYLNPMPDIPQAVPNHPSSSNPMMSQQQQSQQAGKGNAGGLSGASILDLPSNGNTFRMPPSLPGSRSGSPILGPTQLGANGSSTERFLLTAADQKEDGTRDERLNKVIRAKYEAGLLKPFNFIKGYERLNIWMDKRWALNSKLRTLKILSEFRPAFRAIASSLTDLDLIFIEEAFERLLLDYDRVFSTMGIPACLWRRTGEIFKGNREFAELVGIPYEQLRDGKLAIYELMAEDSAVNFWEKYGSIAFDPGQKAVLTSCVLVNQAKLKRHRASSSAASPEKANAAGQMDGSVGSSRNDESAANKNANNEDGPGSYSVTAIPKEALINCTFSFTIRRDAYHIPNAIVGNFMPYTPK